MIFEDTGQTVDIWTPEYSIGSHTYTVFSSSGRQVQVDDLALNINSLYAFTSGIPELPDSHYFTCRECGAVFELSDGEKDFYTQRSLQLPKCCKRCRTLRKAKENKTSIFDVKL